MRTIHPFVFGGLFVSISAALLLGACHSDSDSSAPAPAPLVENLGVAVRSVEGQGDLRMVMVSEEQQGADLDGDGDQLDVVLHLLDLEAGTFENTGLALSVPFQRDTVVPPVYDCNDHLAVFRVDEGAAGRDLDEDGVSGEIESWAFVRRTGEFQVLPPGHHGLRLDGEFAVLSSVTGEVSVFDSRTGSTTGVPLPGAILLDVRDRHMALAVPESPASDFNADGDSEDLVLFLYDVDADQVEETRLAMAPGPVRLAGGFAGFLVPEAAQGDTDLNGDGDTGDRVFFAVETGTGLVRSPGLVGAEFLDFEDPELFLLGVPEFPFDRNGDGDMDDRVALSYDPVRDQADDTGLVTAFLLFRSGRWLGVVVVSDSPFGDLVVHDTLTGANRNVGSSGLFMASLDSQLLAHRLVSGAGGTEAVELVAWDGPRNSVRRIPLDVRAVLGSSGDQALLLLSEHADRNGDGDTDDFVFALYDGRSGRVQDLGLAWRGLSPFLGAEGRGDLIVSEFDQGEDLNGDGDEIDLVLFTLELGS